eukprot:CAMPEP_0176376636 /NCGR_PEP_ID=MMETSP0126-20121128/28342_1 /TAXON_ID=141414 ORGANISM="Strombidinopsis acuminatum, Strain SPMC142" /NCGR_SAMPLE_ID=MMETSP0126 /ASSEMBLY_ACC=CAM_ASM_000229 /LENGTH=180 /DNA_ID=CAMNT_0017738183 /DNA_START=1668 /DNA_END=2210 /DNA_ORIENTATION=-
MLEGKNGCGKTALAASLAYESKFPFVKLITPESFVGFSDFAKISAIVKVFEDAYKSPLSLIVLDDIERLIEFIHIGPRFSNPVLQTLLVLIKKKPPNKDNKLMIIGCTSLKHILEDLEVVDCFNVCLKIPSVYSNSEATGVLSNYKGSSQEISRIGASFSSKDLEGIPIKHLILAIELAL